MDIYVTMTKCYMQSHIPSHTQINTDAPIHTKTIFSTVSMDACGCLIVYHNVSIVSADMCFKSYMCQCLCI